MMLLDSTVWMSILDTTIERNMMVFDSDATPGHVSSRLIQLVAQCMSDASPKDTNLSDVYILNTYYGRWIAEHGKDTYENNGRSIHIHPTLDIETIYLRHYLKNGYKLPKHKISIGFGLSLDNGEDPTATMEYYKTFLFGF